MVLISSRIRMNKDEVYRMVQDAMTFSMPWPIEDERCVEISRLRDGVRSKCDMANQGISDSEELAVLQSIITDLKAIIALLPPEQPPEPSNRHGVYGLVDSLKIYRHQKFGS